MMDDWDIATGVGVTALGAASARAIETHRPDAMIDDPYAEEFVRAARLPQPMPTTPEELAAMSPPGSWMPGWRYMGVRTRFFDDYLATALDAGLRQTVILAAGLDTRAFRLGWHEGSAVFEVDQPRVLSFKLSVLRRRQATPACRHRVVPVDLREEWAGPLRTAGFEPVAATAWLIEGLLPYLDADAERRLLTTVDALSAPGSQVAIEDARRIGQALSDDEYAASRERYGVDLRDLVHEDDPRVRDAAAMLGRLGWKVSTETITAAAERYGHPLDPALSVTTEASRFLVGERTAAAA
ncbi:SAM-dependent methyltransferase [Frankia canadensis]|nr:SAM-dependent methyltransferase [Frankia canadensis]